MVTTNWAHSELNNLLSTWETCPRKLGKYHESPLKPFQLLKKAKPLVNYQDIGLFAIVPVFLWIREQMHELFEMAPFIPIARRRNC